MTDKVEYKTGPHKHLITAFREWIIENEGKPHICVPLAEIPTHLHRLGNQQTGTMNLNISPSAVGNYHCDDEYVSFSCRFNGIATELHIRTNQVLMVYDRENPDVRMHLPTVEAVDPPVTVEQEKKRPSLSVVK